MAGRDPQLLKAVEVGMAQIPKSPLYAPKRPQFPVHPGTQETIASGTSTVLPIVGSAFPTPVAPIVQAAAPSVSNGRFASFVGRFDVGAGGEVVEIKQEGDKLWILTP